MTHPRLKLSIQNNDLMRSPRGGRPLMMLKDAPPTSFGASSQKRSMASTEPGSRTKSSSKKPASEMLRLSSAKPALRCFDKQGGNTRMYLKFNVGKFFRTRSMGSALASTMITSLGIADCDSMLARRRCNSRGRFIVGMIKAILERNEYSGFMREISSDYVWCRDDISKCSLE